MSYVWIEIADIDDNIGRFNDFLRRLACKTLSGRTWGKGSPFATPRVREGRSDEGRSRLHEGRSDLK